MKVSVFACFEAPFGIQPKGSFMRYKITADSSKESCTFDPIKGSEHAVCNHAITAVPKEVGNIFRRYY